MADSATIQRLRHDYRNRQVRWGFIWALWCAVLWGAWYVPGSAIYLEAPFAELSGASTGGYLLAALMITTLNAVAVLLAMWIWIATLGKFGDYLRTARRGRISRWYLPAGLCGGPIAIFGTFLAIGYIGGAFAAVAALLYPIVGAVAARLWYNERITGRAAIGILVIIAGGAVIYAPGILGQFAAAGDGAWIGYLGGAMAMFGWGLEGAIAGRALDVSDPDVGLTLRFTAEVFYWLVIIVPITAALVSTDLVPGLWGTMGAALASGDVLILLALAGLTFGFCYVSWYKSFPLIGVGRGQALAALYGPFAILWLYLFTFSGPAVNLIIGGLIAVLGSFVLLTERRDLLEVIRAVPASNTVTAPAVEQHGSAGGAS